MLQEQEVSGHASLHDPSAAASLRLQGAPIEAPTHFSQFDPLAVALWGQAWFERGCISAHFRTMVIEGEEVQASLTTTGPASARIEAHKTDGTPVLTGTASLGPEHPETELESRRAQQGAPGELFVVDQLEVGARHTHAEPAVLTHEERNGSSYPFSLAEKLERITEPHPWYTPAGGKESPWGRAIIPTEMVSVLAQKAGWPLPVRQPSLGLFLDLEVKLLSGPLFVNQAYRIERELVGLSQSRRTESFWTRNTLTEVGGSTPIATVLLHTGVFKASYAGYPQDRL